MSRNYQIIYSNNGIITRNFDIISRNNKTICRYNKIICLHIEIICGFHEILSHTTGKQFRKGTFIVKAFTSLRNYLNERSSWHTRFKSL